mmetsp:Transcript_34332/g.68365  ORF Transcript_34332/g.68365 Transcript_34332/m.68365 type:complete len:95 (+) Transcript_34332:260-544(+)
MCTSPLGPAAGWCVTPGGRPDCASFSHSYSSAPLPDGCVSFLLLDHDSAAADDAQVCEGSAITFEDLGDLLVLSGGAIKQLHCRRFDFEELTGD